MDGWMAFGEHILKARDPLLCLHVAPCCLSIKLLMGSAVTVTQCIHERAAQAAQVSSGSRERKERTGLCRFQVLVASGARIGESLWMRDVEIVTEAPFLVPG